MKNYSFSNIAAQDSYNARKSNDRTTHYRHSELKAAEANSRIEEIKKKYDTPSRRQRIQSLKKSRDVCMGTKIPSKEQTKQNQVYSREDSVNLKDSYMNHRPAPTFGGNHLKESFAVNRLEKSALKNDINSKELDCMRNHDINYLKTKEDRDNSMYAFKSQTREDEEIIFSKVRQMKESIINNDYMRASINPRSSVSSASYQLADAKNEGGRQFDPRVENIDKINAKIKQILSCLAQGEKNPSKFIKDSSIYPPLRQSSLDISKIQNTKGSYLKTDKSIEATKESTFFGKKAKETEENFFKYNNTQKNIEKLQFESKRPEADSFRDKNALPSFTKQSRQGDRLATKQYRDYSANKVDSCIQSKGTFSKEQELSRTPSYIQNRHFQTKSGLGTSQSRSHIDSIRKSTLTDNQKSDMLKSGKKLNDQISKIQRKIEEFQAQKKKLNIEFTPFSMKNRSSSNLVAGVRFQMPTPQKIEEKNKSDIKCLPPNFRSSSSVKDAKLSYQQHTSQNSNYSRDKQFENQQISKNSIVYGQQSNISKECTFQMKMDQVEVKTVRIEKNNENNEQVSINANSQLCNKKQCTSKSFISSFDEAALRKRADEGIQERKKRLQSADEIIKTDGLKKLVSLFCEQAKLDQNFRNMKIWLESNFSKDKFAIIAKILSQQGVKVTQNQCETLFKIQQSEHNPFFTCQDFNGSFEAVCKSYKQAKNHWQNKIKNKFDQQNLTNEGFTVKKIDLQRKGFIELQDLVRLLNIQSGTFYRNRDIFLIFRRFTKGEKVSFEDILKQLSI